MHRLQLLFTAGSTHAPAWKQAWQLIEAVDRDDLGYNPNSFQISGAGRADPTREGTLVGAHSDEERDTQSQRLLDGMAQINSPATRSVSTASRDAYKVKLSPESQEHVQSASTRPVKPSESACC